MPSSRAAFDRDDPADARHAALEVRKSHARARQADVESGTVVVDLEHRIIALAAKRDSARRRSGVTPHVRERLASELYDVGRLRGQGRCDGWIDVDDRDDLGLGLELLCQLLQGPAEVSVGKDAGAQSEDVVAQVSYRAVDLFDRALEPASDLWIVGRRRGPLQAHANGEQRLDDPVVQLLRDALSLLEQLETGQVALRSLRLLVETRVLDRDAGLRCEHDERFLVLLAELGGFLLLGEIDVAEDGAAGYDGGAEEGPHRRMVWRESHRPRVLRDIGHAEGAGFLDQDAQHPVTDRRITDRGTLFEGHAHGDELLDRPVIRCQDPESPVPRVGDLDREIDDATQHSVE